MARILCTEVYFKCCCCTYFHHMHLHCTDWYFQPYTLIWNSPLTVVVLRITRKSCDRKNITSSDFLISIPLKSLTACHGAERRFDSPCNRRKHTGEIGFHKFWRGPPSKHASHKSHAKTSRKKLRPRSHHHQQEDEVDVSKRSK